jgi:hypothetical protein
MTVRLFLRTTLAGLTAAVLALTASPSPAAADDDHDPDQPTALTTSPATDCAADPPSLIGINDVRLLAEVSDPDEGLLGVSFELRRGDDLIAHTDPSYTFRSGDTAGYRVSYNTLLAAAGDAITTFTWRVRATDRTDRTGPWSEVCSFRYDPTRPAAPVVTAPADTQIGKPTRIEVRSGAGGEVPGRYFWRLNDSQESGIVTGDVAGAATITLTPRRSINSVEVRGLSPAGNSGARADVSFLSDLGDVADEGDLTGDGHSDLLVPGGAHGIPSGLWLGRGDSTGGLSPTVTNLGPRGVWGNDSTDFDGAQISVGRFAGGSFQDVLLYTPGRSRGPAILRGYGDGTPWWPHDAALFSIVLFWDNDGFEPIQLVPGGALPGQTVPDLIGTAGDDASGYHLNYFPALDFIGGYPGAITLTQPTPTGDHAWNTWTLAATATADGTTTLFLWQKSTGLLYAWRDVAFDRETETFSYTEQHLSDAFHPGQPITLQASDINADGTADLWAVGPTATATPWTVSASGALTRGTSRPLVPAGS